ncbi:hypothetical protein [Archaeoglobus profundus]|uniref:Uncharacterized protein n=1 Tax=Archaeoglobus profundus (strain DSM 5631 / JCM 9629 / NBRC 100127 / Av18) TaxID=572546 RepID=D2REG9_ARCPA|nr:hypothetical protein [Archaeoglobus profundus]ADB58513.1 hypothetical protein Arcpr_1466 [Archaeoglobus profundus DSM 5631]
MRCYWWNDERNICRFPWKDYDICVGEACPEFIEDDYPYVGRVKLTSSSSEVEHVAFINKKIKF